jgi:hypothetical protein
MDRLARGNEFCILPLSLLLSTSNETTQETQREAAL